MLLIKLINTVNTDGCYHQVVAVSRRERFSQNSKLSKFKVIFFFKQTVIQGYSKCQRGLVKTMV